jgi:HD superfamily phosphohydrolase
MLIKDIYGQFQVEEPLVTLIKSPALKRLKRVWSGGTARFFRHNGVDFSKYSHSVGVLLLL